MITDVHEKFKQIIVLEISFKTLITNLIEAYYNYISKQIQRIEFFLYTINN